MKNLNCSKEKKKSFCEDLQADIAAALESGETWEAARERMGTPTELAREFNENLGVGTKRTGRNKIILIIFVVILAVIILAIALYNRQTPKVSEVGSSGLFDKTVVLSTSKQVVELINEDNYEILQDQYTAAEIKEALTPEVMLSAKQQLGNDWGEFQRFTSEYTSEVKVSGRTYAGVEIVALYENRSITFTMQFDEDMLLTLLYMK